jgi:nucleoside-diphosphate-sugar epimerase
MTVGTAGITGASGYVGGVIRAELAARGWRTVAYIRRPHGDADALPFDLAQPPDPAVFAGLDVLVHAAWDPRAAGQELWRTNVGGTAALLEAATTAGVRQVILISSISAFEGTRQAYGRAKLAAEATAERLAAAVVRPGLVYGPRAGGMVGNLRRLVRFPVIPLPAARAPQYTVHEDDLAEVVVRLAEGVAVSEPMVAASTHPTQMRELVAALAAREGRRPAVVPVWWPAAFAAMTAAERLHLQTPVRADSLWGLAHPPAPPDARPLLSLGVRVGPFDPDRL